MPLNIVLFQPEIPTNTGNIGRLALASDSVLHLVKPFGFEISDKRVKRAGLDYWKHVDIHIYENDEDFFAQNSTANFAFFSSHGDKTYWDIAFDTDMFLIFGRESVGLSKELIDQNQDRLYKIPLFSDHVRSLNLANAVSIVIYEGLRQLNLK